MKKYAFLMSTVMLGSLFGLSAFSNESLAAQSEAKVKGSATFIDDVEGLDPDNPQVIPPDKPGGEPEVPDGGGSQGNGNKSFVINWVTDLDFNNILIQKTEMKHYADPVYFKNNTTKYAPYIQVTDSRANPSGWNVTAESTPFKAENGVELKGSSIHFKDRVIIASNLQTTGFPKLTNMTELLPNSGPITLMTAGGGEGEGTWTMSFTDLENGRYQPDKGVFLSVPASAVPRSELTYTSDITWTLLSTP